MIWFWVFTAVCLVVLIAALLGFIFIQETWVRIASDIIGVLAILVFFFLVLPGYKKVSVETESPVVVYIDDENAGDTEDFACTEAIKESQTHGDKVLVDLNDGDPFDYSLTIVNPDVPSGNKTLVVLTDPMFMFDVVYPVMYFTSYRLGGTFDQALCSAQKLAGENALAYIYVGKEDTPEGWSTIATEGWWTELVAKQYSEQPITPGGTWAAFQVEANNKSNTISAKTQLVYGQMWDPNKPGIVVHFQIEKGYEFTIPAGWQGTYWTVVDADPVLVQDRLVQASKEVVERDELNLSNVTAAQPCQPRSSRLAKIPSTG